MVAKHRSPKADFPPPGAPGPQQRTMTSPTYVYEGKKPVHVDDGGSVRFQRLYRETRQISAEPDGKGVYTIQKYRRIDFPEDSPEAPETSEWSTDFKRYAQQDAVAEMVILMDTWKSEGFKVAEATPGIPSQPRPAP